MDVARKKSIAAAVREFGLKHSSSRIESKQIYSVQFDL